MWLATVYFNIKEQLTKSKSKEACLDEYRRLNQEHDISYENDSFFMQAKYLYATKIMGEDAEEPQKNYVSVY